MNDITNDRVAYWVMVELNQSNFSTHLYKQTIMDCIGYIAEKKKITLTKEDKEIIFEKVKYSLCTLQEERI